MGFFFQAEDGIRDLVRSRGLGDVYKRQVQNTGTKPVYDITLVATYNTNLYKVEQPSIQVPVLVPGLQYKFTLDVLCTDEDGSAEPVQVYVCGAHSVVPLISAIVIMPLSDIVLADE
eukprot:TRINITY_DN836_c0_g1_i1.p1 TRINITY_DN836_c0_g1~~TRINITY_DN836_c0_g1_i1.p1  ORF type:complete len:117 (-),score=53.75 TRINITY_DN836_c0_g1_i1:227-577(-)